MARAGAPASSCGAGGCSGKFSGPGQEIFTKPSSILYLIYIMMWYTRSMELTPEQYELIRYSGSYLMDQCGYRYTHTRKRWPKVTDKFDIPPEIQAALEAKRRAWNQEAMRPTMGVLGARLPIDDAPEKAFPTPAEASLIFGIAAPFVGVGFFYACAMYGFILWCILTWLGLD